MAQATAIRLIYFLVFCCTGAWLPKLYDYCLYRGLSGPQSALILSITPVMMFAVQPFYGVLADKMGHKKTLISACFFAALSFLGFLCFHGFMGLLFITFFMSIFYNTIQPILDSIALALSKKNTQFTYGNLRFYGAVGWAVTTLITGAAIEATNMTAIFLVSAITMLAAAACSFFINQEVAPHAAPAPERVGNLLYNRKLLLLLISVFFVSMAATSIWNFYSMFMKGLGASDTWVGYGLSLQGLCELPIFYFSARIIARMGLSRSLVLTVFATAIRLLLYSQVSNPAIALPIELLHGLSWSLYWVVCVELVGGLVPKNWLATGQSLLYGAYFGAGAVAGNYWTQFFIDNGHSIQEVFLVNGCIVAGVALLLALSSRHQIRQVQPNT